MKTFIVMLALVAFTFGLLGCDKKKREKVAEPTGGFQANPAAVACTLQAVAVCGQADMGTSWGSYRGPCVRYWLGKTCEGVVPGQGVAGSGR